MPELRDSVVASLGGNRSAPPYSSVAMSPSRKHAVVAGKDTLQLVEVSPKGLFLKRSLRISQHFQTAVAPDNAQMAKIYEDKQHRGPSLRDTFGLAAKQTPASHQSNMTSINVVITDVAWSKPQLYLRDDVHTTDKDDSHHRDSSASSHHSTSKKKEEYLDSIVAAAGSNGVVVVWSARRAFLDGDESSSSMANQQPEAILTQHSRAVNRLAFHPKRPGLLLTASQDATVKLYVRRPSNNNQRSGNAGGPKLRSWFGFNAGPSFDNQSYSWHCRATFEPKSEAVRDIRWSPFHDDIFGLVTVSGCLIVYNMFVPARAIVKLSAHAGDATTLDWHPTRPYVVATGGAGDRCVKVWDLENSLSMAKDDSNMAANSNTANSKTDSIATESSSETDRSGYASTVGSGSGQPLPTRTLSFSVLNATRSKASSVNMLHVLTVSATVTRLKWRPPAFENMPNMDEDKAEVDRHEPMLAVATAPIKGASAGGSGVLGLWSYHRPFMPLSVLEGHKVGAVSDFFWLDTPHPDSQTMVPPAKSSGTSGPDYRGSRKMSDDTDSQMRPRMHGATMHESDSQSIYDRPDVEDAELYDKSGLGVWQHILSVGRDGQCLIQSFARGDRPISRVSPSCFAMANKSPFSRGFGSLQICSVHQRIPSKTGHEFWLAGLRQDSVTARAPGLFREIASSTSSDMDRDHSTSQWVAGKRLPEHIPELVFNVVDRGDLDGAMPVAANKRTITVAPEVVHLSRFAKAYKLHPSEELPTRVDLCLHNADVAESLECGPLSRMWRSLAHMLAGSGLDELPSKTSQPDNVMQFVLLPTLKSLLEERADAGDVQTCVTLCEVLQIIQPNDTTRIPDLNVNLVREWYLTYIDLLRDMCLFSLASFIIGTCKDPFVGALNQQSTTIHEACPRCGKALLPSQGAETASTTDVNARRECKSCQRRIGLCFICHEPVRSLYVWCPGCGHGGHLDHALQWFGGLNGKSVREVCPTGCGHRCNFVQQLSTFPRTGSLGNINDVVKSTHAGPQVDKLPAGLFCRKIRTISNS